MDDRTIEILKRFEASWNQTKAQFDELIALDERFKRLIPVREFISQLELTGGKRAELVIRHSSGCV